MVVIQAAHDTEWGPRDCWGLSDSIAASEWRTRVDCCGDLRAEVVATALSCHSLAREALCCLSPYCLPSPPR